MPKEQSKWLDNVFSAITDSHGRPLIKTHGFGITNPRMLLRYPWFTVDSTTWSLTPGYGQIMVPQYRRGQPDYTQPPQMVITSGVQSASGKNELQFEAMPAPVQDAVLDYLSNHCGVSIYEVRYSSNHRRRCVLIYYLELMEHLKDIRFTDGHSGFFSLDPPAGMCPVKFDGVTVMFATVIGNKQWSELMNDVGANTRLLSYYEIKARPSEDLIEYVTRGVVGAYERKMPRIDHNLEQYKTYRRLHLVRHVEGYDGKEAVTGKAGDGRASTVGQQVDPDPNALLVHRRSGNGVQRSDRDQHATADGLSGGRTRVRLARPAEVISSGKRRPKGGGRRPASQG
jgi:hypothetical protein